ncbi:MAG: hypothetical protein M3Z26_17520 [Bacteroidota bacterium]|nr:hypothetical protein [Bacteroidota bacterium]
MIKYIDKTNLELKSLEVSFLGLDEKNNKEEIPETTDVTIRFLERRHNYSQDIPYKESWSKTYPNILVPTGVWNGMKLGQLSDTKIFVALGTHICELNTMNGEVNWSKNYADNSIHFIKLTTNNDAMYILYSYYKFNGHDIKSNLIKIDLTGKVIWSAKTKERDDSFTSFNYGDNGLSAFTWNCWALKLNEQSGEIVDAKWTK